MGAEPGNLSDEHWPWGKALCSGGSSFFVPVKKKASPVPIREIGAASVGHLPLVPTISRIALIRYFSDAPDAIGVARKVFPVGWILQTKL